MNTVRKTAFLLVTASLILSLSGCGKRSNLDISYYSAADSEPAPVTDETGASLTAEPSVSDAAQNDETQTTENVEPEAEELTAAPLLTEPPSLKCGRYDMVSADKKPEEAADDLLRIYSTIDRMAASAVECDDDETIESGHRKFRKVTDRLVSSLKDVNDFLAAYLTGTGLSDLSYLTGGEYQSYMDFGGSLWTVNEGRYTDYSWVMNNGKISMQITGITPDSFYVSADYYYFGQTTEKIKIKIVRDSGAWKIENCESAAAAVSAEDEFYGEWKSGNRTINIFSDGYGHFEVRIAETDGRNISAEWSYTCSFDSSGDRLESYTGTRTEYVYGTDSTLSGQHTESGKSAYFMITAEGLVWEDCISTDNSGLYEKSAG